MDIREFLKDMKNQLDIAGLFGTIEAELGEAVGLYLSTAASIMDGCGITLAPRSRGPVPLEKNFFSALFLYSYHRAGLTGPRRVLYGAINQALRGIVTGCDNILDDEYKPTLETDLPLDAVRFRSIIDMLVSDRVIFALLTASFMRAEITGPQVIEASRATFAALAESGAQEASEETGVAQVLQPDDILSDVHHYKTGLLFQAPWAVPEVIEEALPAGVESIKDALYDIGMGCQIIDDMVDMPHDIKKGRHNYAVSLAAHGHSPDEREKLAASIRSSSVLDASMPLLLDFPHARQAASEKALQYLHSGLEAFFADEHAVFVAPSIAFLINRLRAAHLMAGLD